MSELDVSAELSRVLDRMERERQGAARQQLWTAEDRWVIGYTTSRVVGGPHAGKFVTLAYKPSSDDSWALDYQRAFSTRKAAKARAVALYRQHSPRYDARWKRHESKG